MKRFNRGSVIPAVLLAFLTVTCSAMADDCDPPPATTRDDGPIQWVPTHREASGNCYQYVNTGPNAGRMRGLLCPVLRLSLPHGVYIPARGGVVQGWNSCADAYLGHDCPVGTWAR
jgi:hypothetical protein